MPSVRLIRHATLVVEVGLGRVLVDPMLCAAGTMPPVENTPNPRRNPLVELPLPAEEVVRNVDLCIVTHLHGDEGNVEAALALLESSPQASRPCDDRSLLADRRPPARGRGMLAVPSSVMPPEDQFAERTDDENVVAGVKTTMSTGWSRASRQCTRQPPTQTVQRAQPMRADIAEPLPRRLGALKTACSCGFRLDQAEVEGFESSRDEAAANGFRDESW
jgi:hypothetical protein